MGRLQGQGLHRQALLHPQPTPAATDRKHLVSVLPVDGTIRLPEGTQLVEQGITVNPAYGPVPMQGFVTSSYHSAALGRSFALALIKNGRNRIGETLVAAAGDQLVDVVVAETVLFDSEGSPQRWLTQQHSQNSKNDPDPHGRARRRTWPSSF